MTMHPKTTLFYDVDTQRDFMLPDGKLYVPGAERIVPRLEALTRFAREKGIPIAGSVDRHFSADPELRANGGEYSAHCMNGTEGQQKVQAMMPRRPVWIENRDYLPAEFQALLRRRGEVYIEKQRFDVFAGNRNAAAVFDTLLEEKEDVVVYGVVTEVCVDQAVTGLKDRPVRLHVPVDAIAALSEKRGKAALEKWSRWGVYLTTVAEVMAELSE
jgi:nicotinamidase/pyrazinamidase